VVPLVLFGLPAGVWVDRLRRRPLLIASDVGRAAVLASIPIAYALDVMSIGQLYVVGTVVRRLGFAPEEVGGVFTLGSIGAFSGALVARQLGARLGVGPTIVGGALIVGSGTAWFALAPPCRARPSWSPRSSSRRSRASS
jgi:MFS family permease